MKSLVIYDSNFGNTKIIADAIAQVLQCEASSVNEVTPDTLNGIGLLIVGSPINAWRPTPKIKSFLNSLLPSVISTMKGAAFDTRVKIFISGNAAKKISRALSEKGARIIAEPTGFYVKNNEGPLLDGEIENAQMWATKILHAVR